MTKDKKHDHYWIEDGQLFESYQTIRGLRYRFIISVDLPDTEKCNDELIEFIKLNYFNK